MSQLSNMSSIHRLVWAGLLAALTAAGAAMAVPVGPLSPVPVTLQTMFVLLSGLILGPKRGSLVMLLYLFAGCLGLPVFAGGKAGLAVLLGPTGGFLIGFVFTAFISGLASGSPVKPFWLILGFCLLGSVVTLALGTAQLMAVMKVSFGKALAAGVLPFLPGNLLKCLAAVFIYRFLAAHNLVPR